MLEILASLLDVIVLAAMNTFHNLREIRRSPKSDEAVLLEITKQEVKKGKK